METIAAIKKEIETKIKAHDARSAALEEHLEAARADLATAEQALASADPTAGNFDALVTAQLSAAAKAQLLENKVDADHKTPVFSDADFNALENRIYGVLRAADAAAVKKIKAAINDIQTATGPLETLYDDAREVYTLANLRADQTHIHIYGEGLKALEARRDTRQLDYIFND